MGGKKLVIIILLFYRERSWTWVWFAIVRVVPITHPARCDELALVQAGQNNAQKEK